MPGLVKISYVNVSGVDIPPHGIIQLTGLPALNPAGDGYVLQATIPGLGDGPYMVDDGGGAKSSGDGQYGTCVRGIDGLCWVAYGCGGGPPSPWVDVGPIQGAFYVNESGTGYTYAGIYDSDNNRILVLMNSFTPETGSCSSGTGSSSSSGSGNNSSSSSSGSCPSGCVRVLTDVYCDAGELVLETACAVACGTLSTIRRVNI